MAKKSYSDKLKDPRWQKKRLEIFKRDKFKCKLCCDEKTTLNVHHNAYKEGIEPWEYSNDSLTTLCEHCHIEVETIKRNIDKTAEPIEIRILKQDNWVGGGRIMWVVYNNTLSLMIYDSENRFIIGYEYRRTFEIKQIAKIINKAINGV